MGKDVSQYQQIEQELSVSNGVIMRRTRVVVPERLRERVVMLAHSGRQGIVKTKRFLSKFQSGFRDRQNGERNDEPLQMSSLPQGPWQELSMDFCGPFPRGDCFLVIVDDFSRYPEVEVLRSTSTKAVIPHLISIFAGQGIPDTQENNGLLSEVFATHLGFTHRKNNSCMAQGKWGSRGTNNNTRDRS